MPLTTNAKEDEVEWFHEDLQKFLELTPKNIGDWNAKLGSQGIAGQLMFGLGVQNEAGQRLTEFCQENEMVIAKTLFQQHERNSTHGHPQVVITEIRVIIFFTGKDGEALYSQQKQDQELTVAQVVNSLLPHTDLN